MRGLLAAILFVWAVCPAHAGVLVELTDGTKLTVESHWNDGQQVHLVRGGVDLIVAKSQIKSLDENVEDPEVYTDHGTAADEPAAAEAPRASGAPAPQEATAQAADPALAELSIGELQTLHQQESRALRELQERSFNASHGGTATAEQKQQAQDALATQQQRTAQIRSALQQAQKAESGGEQSQ